MDTMVEHRFTFTVTSNDSIGLEGLASHVRNKCGLPDDKCTSMVHDNPAYVAPLPKKYKLGTKFMDERDASIYILASVSALKVNLIEINTGLRWFADPVELDGGEVTEKELDKASMDGVFKLKERKPRL